MKDFQKRLFSLKTIKRNMKTRILAIAMKIRRLATESSELEEEIKKVNKKIIRTRKLLQRFKTKKSIKNLQENIKNKRISRARRLHYLHIQSMITLQALESRIHVQNIQVMQPLQVEPLEQIQIESEQELQEPLTPVQNPSI